jgi:LysR family transcriptional regulator for metE and metH
VQPYLDKQYVAARRIGAKGLTGRLYAACLPELSDRAYLADFVSMIRDSCYLNLRSIELL